MPKGSFLEDTFEKLAELGVSTVKKSGVAVKQTFDPLRLAEKTVGSNTPQDKGMEKLEKGQSQKQKHTPLDFDKLQKKYQDQDAIKMDTLRNRLFQLVKGADEKILQEKKLEEQRKKQKEVYELQEKRRKEEERKRIEQQAIPQGKIRRSIFSAKKVAKREQAEVKPAAGKQ